LLISNTHCLLSLKSNDDKFISRHIDGLLTEIYALLGLDHRTIKYTNNRTRKMYCMINVPNHDIGAKFLDLSRRKSNLWMGSMQDTFAGDSFKTEHAAGWVLTYLGRHHKEEAATVEDKLSLGHNN
jgi:hypothetical protein